MSQIERQRATGDIYYEAHMLAQAYSQYWEHEGAAQEPLPDWLHNSVIEATLVHIRSLLDFFERTRKTTLGLRHPCSEDVLAEDYGFPPEAFPLPSNLRKRINTSIAHLSYRRTRITPTERYWDFRLFIPMIVDRARAFFQHLMSTKQLLSEYPGDVVLQQFVRQRQ